MKSNLIVSLLSTVLVELYGYHKKILYYNFCESEAYHSVFNDLILSKSKDWDSFEKELDDLLKIENDDYFKQHNSNMNNYMCFLKITMCI